MNIITIKTQQEFDALPNTFDEYTRIDIISSELISINKAWGNSSVVAWGNSSVEARDNSSVEARDNSSVAARDNSSVVAWDNSSVVARGNSSVVARDNSSVEAWDNSSVEAWGNVGVHLYSDYALVVLFMFAVCWKLAAGKIDKKSKTASIIIPKRKKGLSGWLENNVVKSSVPIILYKKVSKAFLTQENTPGQMKWKIGSIIEHTNWNPKDAECGAGKFHACSRPYFCDEFRNQSGDRYIAVEVDKKDLYAWPNPEYPHKIAFRKGKVLYEVNRWGEKLK